MHVSHADAACIIPRVKWREGLRAAVLADLPITEEEAAGFSLLGRT